LFTNRLHKFFPTQVSQRQPTRNAPWRFRAKLVVSLALIYHMSAILAGALGGHPSSPMERDAAALFQNYFGFVNQGYAYRYYARLDTTVDAQHPHRWSTPVLTLEMEFSGPEGVRQEVHRIPSQERAWPRLRFQRQLDLAYHLTSDPKWVGSYARHVCKIYGCSKVTIYTQEHQIPDLAVVRAAASGLGASVDLEADSTYAHRVKLGEFQCTDF
jgi:hypothetical protein